LWLSIFCSALAPSHHIYTGPQSQDRQQRDKEKQQLQQQPGIKRQLEDELRDPKNFVEWVSSSSWSPPLQADASCMYDTH
jgi:hypothetical protein